MLPINYDRSCRSLLDRSVITKCLQTNIALYRLGLGQGKRQRQHINYGGHDDDMVNDEDWAGSSADETPSDASDYEVHIV